VSQQMTKAAETETADDLGHGNSPAAWTAVVIMLVAFSIGTVAFFFAVVWVVWAAAALVLVGLVVGLVLKRAGYGVGGHRYVPKAHN
jgi:membrane protein YdbS with pleckstrin-like domain